MEGGEYLTPAGEGEAVLVEKRSKFIARVWPVDSEAEAISHIESVRKKRWDATHNVYAYIIRNGPSRFSDDGEPRGTSGMPTLAVFQGKGILNVCCVVTRYFGGVLLGAGGLARAYSGAAKLALECAGLGLVRRWDIVLIPAPYALFEQVKLRVEQAGGMIVSTDFGADALVEAMIPPEHTPELSTAVQELSSGRVEIEMVDSVYAKKAGIE